MFHSARIRLTLWYVLISMLVAAFFSIIIYVGASRESDRILRIQRFRIEHPNQQNTPRDFFRRAPNEETLPPVEDSLINDLRLRILLTLFGVNIVILAISGIAGYFLAGRTLKPIQEMVLEQNRFIADASHELRTPLTALISEIEVTLRDKNLTKETAKKSLVSNLEEAQLLKTLSDSLLTLAFYQKSKKQTQKADVDTKTLITDAIRIVSPLAKKKHITIQTTVEKHILAGDKKGLTDALVILLDNAIKYSSEASKITVTVKKTDAVHIRIQDQGVGIDTADIPHIFDRFYRAEKSRSKTKPGYGLGLAIAKQIITAHNGTIQVESKPEAGSTFVVTLP